MSASKNLIVLHCSASDNKEHDSIAVIREWHIAKGWRDVGYNYFIRKNGVIELGRDEDDEGAHTIGYNDTSIGICLHGLKKDSFTHEQFEACVRLIADIRERHEIRAIVPHNLFANKTCPVFNIVDEIYPRLYKARFQK